MAQIHKSPLERCSIPSGTSWPRFYLFLPVTASLDGYLLGHGNGLWVRWCCVLNWDQARYCYHNCLFWPIFSSLIRLILKVSTLMRLNRKMTCTRDQSNITHWYICHIFSLETQFLANLCELLLSPPISSVTGIESCFSIEDLDYPNTCSIIHLSNSRLLPLVSLLMMRKSPIRSRLKFCFRRVIWCQLDKEVRKKHPWRHKNQVSQEGG